MKKKFLEAVLENWANLDEKHKGLLHNEAIENIQKMIREIEDEELRLQMDNM